MLKELNVIALLGTIAGSSVLTIIVQKLLSKKKDRLDIESVLYTAWKDSIQDNIKISNEFKDSHYKTIKDIEASYKDQINALLQRIDDLESRVPKDNDGI